MYFLDISISYNVTFANFSKNIPAFKILYNSMKYNTIKKLLLPVKLINTSQMYVSHTAVKIYNQLTPLCH